MTEATHAFLLGSVPHREADLIVTLFTRDQGKVGAMARGARRSQKRFGGALSPFHTLLVQLDPARGELLTMREASLATIRLGLTSHLDAMEASGRALRWLKRGVPAKEPHPRLFSAISDLLDEAEEAPDAIDAAVARFGLVLLQDLGYALTLSSCAACGRSRPASQSAYVDTKRGGVVCTSCGGGGTRIRPARLDAWERMQRGEPIERDDAVALAGLVEEVLLAHVDG